MAPRSYRETHNASLTGPDPNRYPASPRRSPITDTPLEDTALPAANSHDRWLRLGWWTMCAAIAARVVTGFVMTRGWFFTNDDWDFITRDGLGQMFEAHQGHLNVLNAVSANLLRRIFGLDYWPGYGFVVAVAWTAVALAAWWVWRRKGVHPLIASGGAILLTWFGSAAYMQFSQVNPAWAIAATLIALDFDQRSISRKDTTLGMVVSLVAVFANTVGALMAGVRLLVSLAHRQWNGVITAGTSFVVFVIVRSLVTDAPPSSFGLGDIGVFFRVIVQLLGGGLHTLIPYPHGYEGLAGILLLVAAVAIVVTRRFEYFATAAIVGAGAWLAAGTIAKFLHRWSEGALQGLLRGTLRVDTPESLNMRFANVVVTFMIVAFIAGRPNLRLLGKRVQPYLPAIGGVVLAGLLAFSMSITVKKWQDLGSLNGVRAEIAGGLFEVEMANEPSVEGSSRRQVGASLGPFKLHRTLDLGAGVVVLERGPRFVVTWADARSVIARGWGESILRSDVFAVRGLPPDAEWSRALHRIDFTHDQELSGSWADLGLDHSGCVLIADLAPMEVATTTRFEIGWYPELDDPAASWDPVSIASRSAEDLILIHLEDDFGPSEIGVTYNRNSKQAEPRIQLLVMGSDDGAGQTILTVTGPSDAVMCHNGVDAEG